MYVRTSLCLVFFGAICLCGCGSSRSAHWCETPFELDLNARQLIRDRLTLGLRHDLDNPVQRWVSKEDPRLLTARDIIAPDDTITYESPEVLWSDLPRDATINLVPLAMSYKSLERSELLEDGPIHLRTLMLYASSSVPKHSAVVVVSWSSIDMKWSVVGYEGEQILRIRTTTDLDSLDNFIVSQRSQPTRIIESEHPLHLVYDSVFVCKNALEQYFGGIPPSLQKYE